ncbi:MAG: PIG-L deacetylase family protein [Alphaproteobacteria bacterium]
MDHPLPLPEPRATPWPGRVLVLAPHPDDETIGCGGAIALHAAQGDPVSIAIATDGGAGDPEGRFARDDYRERRRREARAAAADLGVPEPSFWDLPDGRLSELVDPAGRPGKLHALVRAAIEQTSAEIVYAPPRVDTHPDHHALGRALEDVLATWGPGRPRAFAYDVWVPVHPTLVLDVTAAWEQKERAIGRYETQLAYNDYLRVVRGMAAARTIYLPGATWVEAFAEIPGRA